jgi:UDP-galactopyranose mutase
MQHYDFAIVGAGYAGSVLAERLASQSGKKVLVIDNAPTSAETRTIITMKTVY